MGQASLSSRLQGLSRTCIESNKEEEGSYVARLEIAMHDFVFVESHHCICDARQDSDPLPGVKGLGFRVQGSGFRV